MSLESKTVHYIHGESNVVYDNAARARYVSMVNLDAEDRRLYMTEMGKPSDLVCYPAARVNTSGLYHGMMGLSYMNL